MTGSNSLSRQGEGDGKTRALVLHRPVDLVAVVNKLSGEDVATEQQKIETIDEKLAKAGLPVYVEPGYLFETRIERAVPPWLSYKGQKKIKRQRDNRINPPEVSLPLKGELTSRLREAMRIASREPTLEGGAFVYRQIMEAYALAMEEELDLFHHPEFWYDVRSPLNWFIRAAFTRARTLFAQKPGLQALVCQVDVPLVLGYMFGSTPTEDYHDELVLIFEEAARTAKRQANALLQERRYEAETLLPVKQLVKTAATYDVRVVVRFR